MNRSIVSIALIAAVVLTISHPAYAVDAKANAAASPPAASQTNSQGKIDVKRKVDPCAKLVDINGATQAELMTLPGIGKTEADKIIAGRPYGSKAFLQTRNIISPAMYQALRTKVIAKQKGVPVPKVVKKCT